MIEYIGYIAATLTTCSFLPQAIKTIKTRETKGISLPMYAIFVTGVLFWIAYGILLNEWPIIVGNVITAIFAGIVLIYKLRETIER